MQYLIVQTFWYFEQITGEFRYRIRDPGDALSAHPGFHVINVHIFHPLFAQLALTADILILHLMPDAEIYQVIQLRKKMGKPTIFEIPDNFLSPGPWVAEDDAYRNPYTRQAFFEHAMHSTGLQFSTTEVQKTFGDLNANQSVLENQANHFSATYPEDDRFVFGWGGSKGHDDDLAEIAPVVIEFCRRHPDAEFVYMGYPPLFDKHFAAIPKEQGRLIPAGPIEDYYTFLKDLHVGVAPLRDTEFNRCRSDVKFVEYAAHQCVPVLADCAPYRRHKDQDYAYVYQTPEELNDILERLYQNREETKAVAKRAYRHVSIRRNLPDHVGRRLAFYRSLLRHKAFQQNIPELPETKGLIAYLRKATDRYVKGDYDQALKVLDEALAAHPTYPQGQIWRAKTLSMMGRHHQVINDYTQYTCPPIYFDLLLECLTVAAIHTNLLDWEKLLKGIGNPAIRLHIDPRLKDVPEQRHREVLAANPYDVDALRYLIPLGLSQGDPQTQEWRSRLERLIGA